MMKSLSLLVICFAIDVVRSSRIASEATTSRTKRSNFRSVFDEEDAFWDRFLFKLESISITQRPTKPPIPTKNPTRPPKPTSQPSRAPRPTDSPTPRPSRPPRPTPMPSAQTVPPTPEPSRRARPTPKPSLLTTDPTRSPSIQPALDPTALPTGKPSSRAPATAAPTLTSPVTAAPSPLPTKRPSRSPTAPPSTRRPTPSPTMRPTPLATAPPSTNPTKSPTTSKPTVAPTRRPTRAPSRSPVAPTDAPTLSPTRAPTGRPTRRPTVAPTRLPTTPEPTPRPTNRPSAAPTAPPATFPPTVAPSPADLSCNLSLTSSCTSCGPNNTVPSVDPECPGTPTELTMLFTGGNCTQTSTSQTIPCFDFGAGPPVTPGQEAFIVVAFQSNVYHSAWVNVGDIYVIQNGGGLLGAPQSIVIYNSEDLSPSNVLQSLLFDGSCGQPLLLGNRFGASQVVGFTVNNVTTSAFFNARVELQVQVQPTSANAVVLQRLLTESNAGTFNISDQVQGQVLQPSATLDATFDFTIDLTVAQEISLLSTVQGRSNVTNGEVCTATSFFSITVDPTSGATSQDVAKQHKMFAMTSSSSPPPNAESESTESDSIEFAEPTNILVPSHLLPPTR